MVASLLSPLLVSTSAIGLAEIGDKTQLLAITLAARYRKPLPVILGILIATLVNNAGAAALGAWVIRTFGDHFLNYLVAFSLIGMAVWMLLPEKEDKPRVRNHHFGIFGTAFVSFFIAELGDKTQIAAMALAARYAASYWMVVAGTTLGMMLVNIPSVLIGGRATRWLPMRAVHLIAALIYGLLGVLTLAHPSSLAISPAS